MNADVRTADGELTIHRQDLRYPLAPGRDAALTPTQDHWTFSVDGPDTGAEPLVHLLRYQQVPEVSGFRLVRLVRPPECSAEPPRDHHSRTVVVGERVVVARARTVHDVDYTAPTTLAQLAAVNFLGVPDIYGMLLWTTPSGHTAPLAVATKYLPRSLDGREALREQFALGPQAEEREATPLSYRMGRIGAALHVALATPSSVLQEPVRSAAAEELLGWRGRIETLIDRARLRLAETPEALRLLPRDAAERLTQGRSLAATLEQVALSGVLPLVQRTHGDLNVTRFRRWPAGLMITGFGDEAENRGSGVGPSPAVRDLARLLDSLEGVARLADRDAPVVQKVPFWLPAARERALAAYRHELEVRGHPELLDERLLPVFEAEHFAARVLRACRAVTG